MDPVKMSIPLNRADIGEEEIAAVVRALRGGHLCGGGPAARRVEEQLAERLGVPYVLLTTSCTHALELALMALDVGPGDEVIVPSFTFVSTANVVLRQGATPVFAEIREDTFNLDPQDVERRITSRTRAIIPVHYAGVACEMGALAALADRYGLLLIEDAAQGLNATYRGEPLGTLGDAGAFSFHETKNVTCGEGGALVTRSDEIARRTEMMREKGTNRAAFLRGEVDKYTWVEAGSSFVIADVLAALLEAQLERLDELQASRARLAAVYMQELAPLEREGFLRLPTVPAEAGPNWHLFHLTVESESERDRCLALLRSRGIGAAFHFVPLHSSPFGRRLAGDRPVELPITDRVSQTLLRLPLYPQLTSEEQAYVVEAVYDCFGVSAASGCLLSNGSSNGHGMGSAIRNGHHPDGEETGASEPASEYPHRIPVGTHDTRAQDDVARENEVPAPLGD
jgi:dTDP-4-amino-4,6-dideoxygalactose transaminase